MRRNSDFKSELPSVEIVVLPEGAGRAEFNAALNTSLADVVVLCGPSGGIIGRALPLLAEIFLDPSVIVAYSDEEIVDSRGRHLHSIYKPDWSPERFRSQFYIGGLLAVRRSEALRAVLDSAIDDSKSRINHANSLVKGDGGRAGNRDHYNSERGRYDETGHRGHNRRRRNLAGCGWQ